MTDRQKWAADTVLVCFMGCLFIAAMAAGEQITKSFLSKKLYPARVIVGVPISFSLGRDCDCDGDPYRTLFVRFHGGTHIPVGQANRVMKLDSQCTLCVGVFDSQKSLLKNVSNIENGKQYVFTYKELRPGHIRELLSVYPTGNYIELKEERK